MCGFISTNSLPTAADLLFLLSSGKTDAIIALLRDAQFNFVHIPERIYLFYTSPQAKYSALLNLAPCVKLIRLDPTKALGLKAFIAHIDGEESDEGGVRPRRVVILDDVSVSGGSRLAQQQSQTHLRWSKSRAFPT